MHVAFNLPLFIYYGVILAGWLVSAGGCLFFIRRAAARVPFWLISLAVVGTALLAGVFWSQGCAPLVYLAITVTPPLFFYAHTLLSRDSTRRSALLVGLFPTALLSTLMISLLAVCWIEHFVHP